MEVRQVLPRDAIPSVDDPTFRETHEGAPDDEVVVLVVGEEVRAYPIRYLHYHEIVNDRVGDRPVAVTWCPLCGSAVVYDRTVGGLTLEFGVSGKLADDDLVMYDRQTGSEWKQTLGEAIAGPHEGATLEVLPASVMPYRRYDEAHPDGVVLEPPGGESEASGPGDEPEPVDYDEDPYREYFEAAGFEFEPTDDPRRFAADGTSWDGATGEGADGRQLTRVPARRLFAFAWQDDHGPDSFYAGG